MDNVVNTVAMVLQILSALGVILLVLLQHGKGADMGAAFGSGASGSLFGATGSANFLSRLTAAMAAVFFVSTLALAFFANQRPQGSGSLMEGVVTPPSSVPTLPGSSAPPSSTVPPAPSSGSPAASGAGSQAGGGQGNTQGSGQGGQDGARTGGNAPAGEGSGPASQIPK